MSYYIMYKNDSDYEMTVVPYDTCEQVTGFIGDKINKHGYRLDDFKVIQGMELSLKLEVVLKVLLTNQS